MLNRYVLIGGACFLMGFGAGGIINGWRLNAKISTMEAQQAEAMTEAHEKNALLSQRLAEADSIHTEQLEAANEKNNALMRDVESGRKRLRVKATCPMPDTAPRTRMGDAASPELDTAARQDYYALRNGIERVTAQLGACQDILRRERE
jgi:prophage endopeptidase